MPESDCSTEFWEFVPYTIMLDYKSNTHDNVMYPHFLERPMSIVWWPGRTLRVGVRGGSGAGPGRVRSGSGAGPERVRSGSGSGPGRVRTGSVADP